MRHSHDFLLPCITVKEEFIIGTTLFIDYNCLSLFSYFDGLHSSNFYHDSLCILDKTAGNEINIRDNLFKVRNLNIFVPSILTPQEAVVH